MRASSSKQPRRYRKYRHNQGVNVKYLVPMIVALFLIQTASALIVAQSIGVTGRDTAQIEEETPVQFTQRGAAYKHGSWCMDERAF